MQPDPAPWYSTTLNVWTLATVLVASWTLTKTVTEGWRRTIGRRRYLITRLRKIAPGVRHDYVESLLGEPKWQSMMECTRLTADEAKDADQGDRKVEITVRTWPLSRLGYLVTWGEDDTVVMYGITTISWWFRPRVLIGDTRIRLGKSVFAALADSGEHSAWLGNRRFGYREHHYFGNPGGYRSWYIGVNDIGYNAVSPLFNWFDDADDSRMRLLADRRALYRASAPINTVVISGTALYEEVQEDHFFGTSLGVDQDTVRLADPEYQVLDSRISRAHRRFRDWRWRMMHRRREKRLGALYDDA
ncbi:ETEC_3214 domain-containing protein [Streptomyces sp. NPDC056337]|uniref:ETEC_3214 domain-containing protein n=1 Tax=Streptomyces sp. NPDC056337 TaxID=3345787 RepID=UPI0035D5481A